MVNRYSGSKKRKGGVFLWDLEKFVEEFIEDVLGLENLKWQLES
jgi:hypothetical protein